MKKTRDYADIMTDLVETGLSETEAYTFITFLMGYDQGYSKGVKIGAALVVGLMAVVLLILKVGGL